MMKFLYKGTLACLECGVLFYQLPTLQVSVTMKHCCSGKDGQSGTRDFQECPTHGYGNCPCLNVRDKLGELLKCGRQLVNLRSVDLQIGV